MSTGCRPVCGSAQSLPLVLSGFKVMGFRGQDIQSAGRHFVMVLLLASLVVTGCGLVYTDVRVPRAYRSATPADVESHSTDRMVTGEGCNRSLLYLVAWGDASYAAAVRDALGGDADAILYDVKADVKATTVLLGLYAKVCTVVAGRVAAP